MLPEFISKAGDASSSSFFPDFLLFLILKDSLFASITKPVCGMSPNNVCIPVRSLKDIPKVSSSTILLIFLGIFFETNNSM